MPLPDYEIHHLCSKHAMVVPFDPDLVNPASIDVLLGDRLMVEVKYRHELEILGIAHYTQADPYWLAPGEFCLAETREIFNQPGTGGPRAPAGWLLRPRVAWQQADAGAH